jgi:HlyD family secretion protein
MKSRWIIPIVAVIALVFSVAYVVAARPVHRSAPPPSTPAEAVSDHTVAAVGLVEPESENIEISTPLPGLVVALHVGVGDRVHTGQPLFALDDRDLRGDLQVKRTALRAARARLARLEEQPRPEEIPPAEQRVAAAAAQLKDADVQLHAVESVTDRRAVREEDVLRRRAAVDGARARLAETERALDLLKAGAWLPDVEIARSEVAQAEAGVRQLEINIDRLTVRAPMDGVILQNKVRLGQYASAGQIATPLMVLGGGQSLHVRADVDENEAWRVRANTEAVAFVRGNSALRYPLEFVRFEPYVVPKHSLTGDPTERVDTRVLQVIYRVRDAQAPLYDGQQMDIYVDTPVALHRNSASSDGGQR